MFFKVKTNAYSRIFDDIPGAPEPTGVVVVYSHSPFLTWGVPETGIYTTYTKIRSLFFYFQREKSDRLALSPQQQDYSRGPRLLASISDLIFLRTFL